MADETRSIRYVVKIDTSGESQASITRLLPTATGTAGGESAEPKEKPITESGCCEQIIASLKELQTQQASDSTTIASLMGSMSGSIDAYLAQIVQLIPVAAAQSGAVNQSGQLNPGITSLVATAGRILTRIGSINGLIQGMATRLGTITSSLSGSNGLLQRISTSVQMVGRQLRQQHQNPQNPQPQNAHRWLQQNNMLHGLMSRLIALGVGGLGAAANPMSAFGTLSAAGGAAGALVGGPAGIAIATAAAAIAGLATAAMSAADSLKDYNGALFAQMTQFDFFMMGFKYKMAAEIGPSLAQFVAQIERLIIASEPLIADLARFSVAILEPIIDGLIRFTQYLAVATSAISLLASWINFQAANPGPGKQAAIRLQPGQTPEAARAALNNSLVNASDRLTAELKAVKEPLDNLANAANKMLEDGHRLSQWLFRGARQYAHAGPMNNALQTGFVPTNHQINEVSPRGALQKFIQQHGGGAVAQKEPPVGLGGPAGVHNRPNDQQFAPTTPTVGLPRPTPAAAHFHIADGMQITPAEDDRLHAELMGMSERVWNAMDAMNTGRWMRFATARARVGDW